MNHKVTFVAFIFGIGQLYVGGFLVLCVEGFLFSNKYFSNSYLQRIAYSISQVEHATIPNELIPEIQCMVLIDPDR